jgi:NAD dependent epimerase/dehydratase family enzyme
MNILVIGATGFIGNHFVKLASEQSHAVAMLSRKNVSRFKKMQMFSKEDKLFEKRRDKKEEEEIRKSLKIDIKNEFQFYINDNKYLEEENLIKENILKIKLNELKEKNKILKSNFEELDKLLKQLET